GPEKSPASSATPSKNTPSVQLCAVGQPCARVIAASNRTVVVLPLDPVTSAVGSARNAVHGTLATDGKACAAHAWPCAPAPIDTTSSSASNGTPCASASACNASKSGLASASART